EVARLDEVAVDDAQKADAGPHQHVRQHRAQRPAAAQRHARGRQLLLPGLADAVEAHLPAVALEGRVRHQSASSSYPSPPAPLPRGAEGGLFFWLPLSPCGRGGWWVGGPAPTPLSSSN